MGFPIHLLTTVADCDALLTSQQREQARLRNRLAQLDHQLATWESPEELEARLAATRQAVAALEAAVAATPVGPARLRLDSQRLRYALRLNRLLLRAENRGRRPRLERELARAQAQASLALLDAFLAELRAQRAFLLASSAASLGQPQRAEAQATELESPHLLIAREPADDGGGRRETPGAGRLTGAGRFFPPRWHARENHPTPGRTNFQLPWPGRPRPVGLFRTSERLVVYRWQQLGHGLSDRQRMI